MTDVYNVIAVLEGAASAANADFVHKLIIVASFSGLGHEKGCTGAVVMLLGQ